MKKLIISLIIAMCLQTTVFADFTDVSYVGEEEYGQTLSTGLEYFGYSGELRFSVTDTDAEEIGMKLVVPTDEYTQYVPFEIPFTGDITAGNFSMRIGGTGLIHGDYTIMPYMIKDGVKTYGESKTFNISENCAAMRNLRIAYDQISGLVQEGIFTEDELEIVNYIMNVADDVIKDGEAGNEITKEYIQANYFDECAAVKGMYDALGDDPSTPDKKEGSAVRITFAGKFGEKNIDKKVREYLISEFGLIKFI